MPAGSCEDGLDEKSIQRFEVKKKAKKGEFFALPSYFSIPTQYKLPRNCVNWRDRGREERGREEGRGLLARLPARSATGKQYTRSGYEQLRGVPAPSATCRHCLPANHHRLEAAVVSKHIFGVECADTACAFVGLRRGES